MSSLTLTHSELYYYHAPTVISMEQCEQDVIVECENNKENIVFPKCLEQWKEKGYSAPFSDDRGGGQIF
jgi:hypothetical protein